MVGGAAGLAPNWKCWRLDSGAMPLAQAARAGLGCSTDTRQGEGHCWAKGRVGSESEAAGVSCRGWQGRAKAREMATRARSVGTEREGMSVASEVEALSEAGEGSGAGEAASGACPSWGSLQVAL